MPSFVRFFAKQKENGKSFLSVKMCVDLVHLKVNSISSVRDNALLLYYLHVYDGAYMYDC